MPRPISSSDLAFRYDEAAELANVLLLDLSKERVERIVEETGGWPIALRLSLTADRPESSGRSAGIRSKDVLFKYIEEQVWDALNADERDLLESAAILPQPGVAVLGAAGFLNAGIALEKLAKRVAFLERDDAGEFHLHDIFREFINERHRLDAPRFEKAVRNLAHALASLGLSAESLRLFSRLQSNENILAILAESGFDLIEAGEKHSVLAAIGALSARYRDDPVACGLRGHLMALEGAFASAELEMRKAVAADCDTRFKIAVSRRLAIFWVNRAKYSEAVALIEDLLFKVGKDTLDWIELNADLATARSSAGDAVGGMRHASIAFDGISVTPSDRRAQVLARIAHAYFFARQHSEAEAIATEAVSIALQLGQDALASRIYSLLYSIAEETHQDTTRAEYYARSMGAAAENAGDKQLKVASLERLLETATLRGDDEVVAQAERQLVESGHVRSYRDSVGGRVSRAMYELGRKNFKQACRIIETLDPRDLSTAEAGLRSSLLCVCLIAEGRRDEAAQILEKPFLIEVEPDLYSRRFVALARGHRAIANWMLGRSTVARQTVTRDDVALTVGLRIFLEVVASICGVKRSSASDRIIHQLTEPLVALNFGGYARFLRSLAAVSYLPVNLTQAEVDLLRAWRTGDTITELADRIGKSPHTVNTQMRTICRKTGTSGRAEALAYARDHGLI
jgi:DNA-binding CsgD family transcriptional regulator